MVGRAELRSSGPFLLPWLLVFSVFWAYPFVHSLVLSILHYSPLSPTETVVTGLDNYHQAMTSPVFWQAVRNTIIFVVAAVPSTCAIALVLAVLFHKPTRLASVCRTLVFIPSVISMVAVALVFRELYSPDGPLGSLLGSLGFRVPHWLQDPRTALPAIIVMDVWEGVGFYMLIFWSGLKAIPEPIYEAARLEGSGFWTTLTRITVPCLRPIILFALTICSIRSFQIFIEIYCLTRGGPMGRTLTMVYHLYDQAFYHFEMGYASAVAVLLLGLTAAFSIAYGRMLRGGMEV